MIREIGKKIHVDELHIIVEVIKSKKTFPKLNELVYGSWIICLLLKSFSNDNFITILQL